MARARVSKEPATKRTRKSTKTKPVEAESPKADETYNYRKTTRSSGYFDSAVTVARDYQSPALKPWTAVQKLAWTMKHDMNDGNFLAALEEVFREAGEASAAFTCAHIYIDDNGLFSESYKAGYEEGETAALADKDKEVEELEEAKADLQRDMDDMKNTAEQTAERFENTISELASIVEEAVEENQPKTLLEALHAFLVEHGEHNAQLALSRWI